jgi:alkanesulfonate monooxygenase SsuD/methylene tetrahydromethanopterin reductase-like flavin-dependent oxidoreductase (luciferase family)
VGVIERHCEDVGRDPSEITKTKLGTLVLRDSDEEAQAIVGAFRDRGMPEDRLAAFLLAGDADAIAEQVAAHLDAGLDGMIVNMPDAYDLEQVAAAGELLSKVIDRN